MRNDGAVKSALKPLERAVVTRPTCGRTRGTQARTLVAMHYRHALWITYGVRSQDFNAVHGAMLGMSSRPRR